jgi:hypothetical protein
MLPMQVYSLDALSNLLIERNLDLYDDNSVQTIWLRSCYESDMLRMIPAG